MSENHHVRAKVSKRAQCYGMCGGRSRIFCGMFFIIIGLFWFGKEANLWPSEFMTLFWPLIFILAGIWFITAALRNRVESTLK